MTQISEQTDLGLLFLKLVAIVSQFRTFMMWVEIVKYIFILLGGKDGFDPVECFSQKRRLAVGIVRGI
jgi:hypothetical protein